jgi:hypothetical protein
MIFTNPTIFLNMAFMSVLVSEGVENCYNEWDVKKVHILKMEEGNSWNHLA